MKRYLAATAAILFSCIFFSLSSYGEIDTPVADNPDLSLFTSEHFGFSISIPRKWHKSDFNLQYKHIVSMKGPGNARVKVTAAVNDDEEKETWNNWKDWYSTSPGNGVSSIIEKKTRSFDRSGKGTLYIFEYHHGKQQFLVRLLLVKLENALIAIECGAPTNQFYKNAALFDAVMSSLKIGETEGK